MNPIDFRFLLYEVAEYAALPLKSRARKRAFEHLHKQILVDRAAPRSGWKSLQIAAMIVDFLGIAWIAAYAFFAPAPKEWVLWAWLGLMAILSALFVLTEVKMRQADNRWIHQGLDKVVQRLRTFSPAEFDDAEALLWNDPAYIRKHPIASPAACGCIHCGQRFAAREILRDREPPRGPLCPRCGASKKFLVYSDEGINVTKEALERLQNLFNEEN